MGNASARGSTVSAWEETVTLFTYPPPPPDKNPMFLEHRVNQGTSGRVYPNPFTDGVSSVGEEQEYQAVFLENEYLRLMMLPQIGGRIHVGMDKTNGYHFVYCQHVIKPALIGLFGSWLSGGVEFNWPQHHRPSTFMPVNYLIERGDDGSATVWLSEHDPMDRMKGMVGICLYPGRSFLEMKVQLYNRTPMVQTFLWWINFAVRVHDQYQVVFPPDVTVVTDHSKRSMAHYPLPRGSYYGVEYGDEAAGDISWPKNIPVPISYFVWETREDFFGGYDHRRDAGVIHVANHYIAPGKKMFTWGFGDFGDGWERNLTDDDGPYIELMAGVYTDNQPDFSWLQPYETKTFSQFWYPIQAIGPAKNANRRVAVNLEVGATQTKVGVAATERLDRASISLSAGEQALLEQTADLAPDAPFVACLDLPEDVEETDLLLRVCDGEGRELIRYGPQVVEETPLPEAKTPPPPPETFETVEALYLTGLHLEQYRHPTIDPEPYWEAALARDPTDVRCNNAMGLVHLRRGNLEQAEAHFRAAIETLTRRNPNPRDGEPYYNLGLALRWQGRDDEAYAAFYKGIWSYAWQAAGYYALAEIDCLRGDLAAAQEHLDRSLLTNAMNTKARNLKAAVLRKGGWYAEAAALATETMALDLLDMWSRNEMVLLSRAQGKAAEAERQLGDLTDLLHTPDWLSEVQAYLDMAFDYAHAGFWDEASDLLRRLIYGDSASASAYPMLYYALGYCLEQLGQHEEARALYRRASELPADYCFPVRLIEMVILQHVQSVYREDARVAYYLGNLYYDKKRYDEAIRNWELSVRVDPGFSISWRNLGIAYYNVRHDADKAVGCYEEAVKADHGDGRVLYELQQLLGRTGAPPEARLARLEERLDLVRERDDLSTELAALYNQTGQPQKVLDFVLSRRFHPWEGGTGWVSAQYETAHFVLAQAALDGGDPRSALEHLKEAQVYPHNLGEGRHLLRPNAYLHYHVGLAKQALGDQEGAAAAYDRVLEAKGGLSETAYYQALALRQLGRADEAREKLQEMLQGATQKREEEAKSEFATSVPQFIFAEQDLQTRRRTHYTYLIGLAHLGLGQTSEAVAAFQAVLVQSPDHFDTQYHLRRIEMERG
jgi:tetratricopeptide (TPR) repeat protein